MVTRAMTPQRLRPYLLSLGVIAVCSIALAYFLWSAEEPVCQGKSLSAWLADLRWTGGSQHDRAAEAIRQIGTNGLPRLVELLGSHRFSFRQKWRAWFTKLPFFKSTDQPQLDYRWQATCAFKSLGSIAKPALPELAKLLRQRINPGYVTTALAGIGPASVPLLCETLANDDHDIRMCAAAALGTLGPAGRDAVPALINSLEEKIPHVLAIMAQSLAQIDQGQNRALPQLIENMASADVNIRRGAVMALSYYDQQAKAAIPALTLALKDVDQQVREFSILALDKIAPKPK